MAYNFVGIYDFSGLRRSISGLSGWNRYGLGNLIYNISKGLIEIRPVFPYYPSRANQIPENETC